MTTTDFEGVVGAMAAANHVTDTIGEQGMEKGMGVFRDMAIR
jgi:hypothetical protein